MPRAKGSAGAILKRSSHISITLVGATQEKKKRAPKKAAANKSDAPVTEEPAATEAANA
jgi:hypothetical protein